MTETFKDGTYLENSGVYMNGTEITSVYCENCKEFCQVKVINRRVDLDTCLCVRIRNRYYVKRLYLETKGNILCKLEKMYDPHYNTSDDEDEDEDDDDSSDDEDEHKREYEYNRRIKVVEACSQAIVYHKYKYN